MGSIQRIFDFDVTELPEMFIDFLFSFTFQVMVLATIYYGGTGMLIYYIHKLPPEFIIPVWMVGCMINSGLVISFPGLFYFDKMPDLGCLLVVIGLGPLTLPRALACYLSFRWNVKSESLHKDDMMRAPVHHLTTYRSILRKHVSEWDVDDPWMNAIKRNTDIGIPSFKDKCRKKWNLVVRIARWKVL